MVGCLVAAIHGYFLYSALIHRTYLTDDSIQYLTIAENLASSGEFSQGYSPPLTQDLQRTPGYPIFLLLLGRIPFLVLLVQHILVLVTAWLIYRAALESYGPRVASAGAGLYLLQPYPAIFASMVLSETLFVVLLMAAFWGFLRFWKGGGGLVLAGAMALLSLGVLVRPVAMPLLLAAVVFLSVRAVRRRSFRPSSWLAIVLVPLLVVGPWMVRNHQVSGRWMLSSMGSMGMLHGRMGGLEAWREGKPMDERHWYMAGDSIAALETGLPGLRSYPVTRQTHETELLHSDASWLTVSFFLSHPWDALRFEIRCIWEMLKGVGYGWARELTLFPAAAIGSAILQLICNLLMYIGALLGMRRWREWGVAETSAFFAILLLLLVSAAVWADGRYRMVVDPFLLVLTMSVLRRQERSASGG
ncbi:MAG: hypothetical protein RLZZ165_1746 [Bacteroidota bacterium]